MYGTLPYYIIGLLFKLIHTSLAEPVYNITSYKEVKFYEYGTHMEGEQLAYSFMGIIPIFEPQYMHNITMERKDLVQKFNYLRVEYISFLSAVDILYDPEKSVVEFHIRFPFLNIPYNVAGYSVKIVRSKMWISWK